MKRKAQAEVPMDPEHVALIERFTQEARAKLATSSMTEEEAAAQGYITPAEMAQYQLDNYLKRNQEHRAASEMPDCYRLPEGVRIEDGNYDDMPHLEPDLTE